MDLCVCVCVSADSLAIDVSFACIVWKIPGDPTES